MIQVNQCVKKYFYGYSESEGERDEDDVVIFQPCQS